MFPPLSTKVSPSFVVLNGAPPPPQSSYISGSQTHPSKSKVNTLGQDDMLNNLKIFRKFNYIYHETRIPNTNKEIKILTRSSSYFVCSFN
uniref:Uncharacterized protein n=1 Tax=Lepeophtheirus salmonis TaxID=72036 RepID=A0A0K2T6S4_LEPSM